MQLSRFAVDFTPSPLPDLLVRSGAADVISFAVGLPAGDLLPNLQLERASAALLGSGTDSLQYGVPCRELKRQLVALMRRRGVSCVEEQIFLCSGAQQGLKLVSQLLIDPGREVMMESRVFDGIRTAVREQQPAILALPSDPEAGLDVDAVESALKAGARPAFLYLIPEAQNPLGCSLSLDKRQRLLELAEHFCFPILEDDACGLLSFGEALPALRSLDDRSVLYVGTLSKIVAPGLRVGWLILPESIMNRASMIKHAADFDTSTHAQHLAAMFLADGGLDAHLEGLRREYARRAQALQEALAATFFGRARWSRPSAGMYVWLELAPEVDTRAMLDSAIEQERVAYLPGVAFSVTGRDHNCLRLCFGNLTPDRLREGVARLAHAVERWTRS